MTWTLPAQKVSTSTVVGLEPPSPTDPLDCESSVQWQYVKHVYFDVISFGDLHYSPSLGYIKENKITVV